MKTIDQIAAQLQGYDPQALTVDSVHQFLAQLATPVTQCETLGIVQALGRVLAQDVISPISVPPHDNSAMDGYAFDGAQLSAQHALVLKVVGTALAGKAWAGTLGPGECVKIMTGAVMPHGLDTVVPQELVTAQALDCITLGAGLLQAGDNRRRLGEDLQQGQPALRQGQRLLPAALGLLASLGLPEVTVFRRLRVAYFSTGDEILSLGEAPREGAVFDSNRYTVLGLLTRWGCEVVDLGVVRDEPALLERAFLQAAAQADVIITSGGVSVGEADYTKTMMRQLGDVAFWKIAMRPGRPMAVGRISNAKYAFEPYPAWPDSYQNNSNAETGSSALLFGLPGNPVAVMVTMLALVRPALLQMMGSQASAAPLLQARSSEAIRKKPGRTEYQRGIVSTGADGSLQVKSTGNQGSGVLSSMAQANGLIVLHHNQSHVNPGDTVDVMMFEGAL